MVHLILRCFCNNDLGHLLNNRASFQKEVTSKKNRQGLRAWVLFEILVVWSLKQDFEKKALFKKHSLPLHKRNRDADGTGQGAIKEGGWVGRNVGR